MYCYICARYCLAEVTCEPLVAPNNGVVIPRKDAGGTFGDNVTYNCDRGYDLSEAVVRTCQADGQWSGKDPTCTSEIAKLVKVYLHSLQCC